MSNKCGPEKLKCDSCRTINLAKHVDMPKTADMQLYEKCTPPKRISCGRVTELPVHPICIKVCTKEEYNLRKSGKKITPKVTLPGYGHGKLMYAVKAGILVGTFAFTYSQGVWGDQQDVMECLKRWQEYIRSINTRTPPVFDQSGHVVQPKSTESVIAPAYAVYKGLITTVFSGMVKVPVMIKCMFLDYQKAMNDRREAEFKARKLSPTP